MINANLITMETVAKTDAAQIAICQMGKLRVSNLTEVAFLVANMNFGVVNVKMNAARSVPTDLKQRAYVMQQTANAIMGA